MGLEWDVRGIFALLIFAGCILFLGLQFLRLYCPLHRRLRSKFLADALTSCPAESGKAPLEGRRTQPALSDAVVRSAVPLRAAVRELQFGAIPPEDMRLRRFWWRAWIYVAAALVFAYTAPAFLSESSAAVCLTAALCAYSLGLLLRCIADFRERLVVRRFCAHDEMPERRPLEHGKELQQDASDAGGDDAARNG